MLLLIAAVAPAALLLHFVYIRDKYEREPLGQVARAFFIGCLTVIPAAAFEMFVLVPESFGLLGIAISAFLVIALSEELVKFAALRWFAVPQPSFNEVYDGIIYGVAISLGFATVENLLYVFFSGESGLYVALLRAVLAVPGHALWGVMLGYYIGRARFEPNPGLRAGLVWRGILSAIFWHGLYDYFAFGAEAVGADLALLFGAGVIGVVLVNWIIALWMIRDAQQRSSFKRPNPLLNPIQAFRPGIRFCHRCGRPAQRSADFCIHCGYRYPGSGADRR